MGYAFEVKLAIFLFGLIVGSFLNAVIWRLSTSSRSIFEKHSVCPKCEHVLAWRDLVPLASFFMLRGRCRYCKKPISWQYPLVELATAVCFTVIYWQYGLSLTTYLPTGQAGYLLLITCFLIVIFVYDLKHYLILDKVLIPATAAAALYQFWQNNFWNGLWGALALSGFFGLLYLVSRGRWIGFGDVKLGIFLGFLVPWPVTLALFFLAYVVGAAVSLGLLAFGTKRMRDRLPFGTFLCFGAFLAMLWGEEMIEWYFRLIGLH